VVKEGRFLAKTHKQYTFIYQIHTDGSTAVNDSSNTHPLICWSLYAKLGRQTEMIWKFHRFSPSVLKEVYPNYTESPLNINSQNSLLENERNQPLIIGQSQAPVDRLARYLEYVCRLIADQTLTEAERYKSEFLEMPMGSITEQKSEVLTSEQKKAWEDYWME
jgi:hypothetical protein